MWRDAAGVLVASIVVLAYVGVGFVVVLVQVLFGVTATFPESWNSAMLSLASAALGYLIAKKMPSDDGYSESQYQEALRALPPGATLTATQVTTRPHETEPPAESTTVKGG